MKPKELLTQHTLTHPRFVDKTRSDSSEFIHSNPRPVYSIIIIQRRTMTKLTIHLTVAAAAGAPRVPLEITPDISSAELRKQASEVTKIPPTALKLIFRGRMIANDESTEAVTEYKLEDGSVLHCMGKPVENAAPAPSAAAPSSNAAPATGAAALPSVNLIPPAAAAAATSMTGGNSSGDPLAQALQTMRASNPPQVYKTAVETLEKLLAKIIENPLEEKYRRVKKENPAFVRKLGGLTGGAAAVKATGFVEQMDESGQPVYQMVASADAWPKLLTAQTTVKNAAQAAEASVAAPSLPTGMPGFPPANPGMAGMPGMPDMSQAAASLMQNPQALEGMLQVSFCFRVLRKQSSFE